MLQEPHAHEDRDADKSGNRQFFSPSSFEYVIIGGVFCDPEVLPRVGDEYQIVIPLLTTVFLTYKEPALCKNPMPIQWILKTTTFECRARISNRYPDIFIFCQLVALKCLLLSVINQNSKVISHFRIPHIIDDKVNIYIQ